MSVVLAALADAVELTPDAIAVRSFDNDAAAATLSYGSLYEGACAVAAALKRLGVGAGDRVVLSMPSCAEFFGVYLGCLAAGIIPAVVVGARAQAAAEALGARLVVWRGTGPGAADGRTTRSVGARELLGAAPGPGLALAAAGEPIAHLQGTSGTTSEPRWAVIRHDNVAANVQAIGRAIDQRTEDVLVTWLPMSHDMGLIGVSYAWFWRIPIVAADPSNFVRNPLFWLDLIDKFAGTLSPAPNSAFQACSRVAKLRPPRDLDLSSWRVALCGAEPVHESTMRDFYETFGRFGLRREVLMPVYGLAESTLAVSISSTTEPFRVERVAAGSAARDSVVLPCDERQTDAISVVGCGRVVPEHALRVVGSDGRVLAEGMIGEIEVGGGSVFGGYFGSDDTAELKHDGFLRTGDLGYLRDGEIFITGRLKEIFILNGRNFSPLQIEATLERLLEAPFTPAVIAVDAPDEHLRSDALHLLLDGRLGDRRAIEARVRQALDQIFGLHGVPVHWVSSGHIPRTTSGKIQRVRCRELIGRRAGQALASPAGAARGTR
jgi:fatty-acyl-CoA synthase